MIHFKGQYVLSEQNLWMPENSGIKSLKCWEEKICRLKILYSAKISLKNINEINTFSDKIYCYHNVTRNAKEIILGCKKNRVFSGR